MMTAERPMEPRWGLAIREADTLSEVYGAAPVPVVEVAERNGVEVVVGDFGRNRDRVSGLCDFEKRKILVNSADAFVRRCFTIAHELGHWVLHRRFYEENPEEYRFLPRFRHTDDRGPSEREANCFAAHLLVPDRLLVPVVGAATATELADIFHVSRTEMEYRIREVRRRRFRGAANGLRRIRRALGAASA